MERPPVRLERLDAIGIISIDRPAVRNALNGPAVDGLIAALDAINGDDECRICIMTGDGGHFCAGADLKEMHGGGEAFARARRQFADLVRRRNPKPVIAAVEGFAVGGGCELALWADLIVAAEDARFGLPEVRHGLLAAGGGILRLPGMLPPRIALEYLMTGALLDAGDAFRLGMINRLSPKGGALRAAIGFAEQITVNAPLSVEATRNLVRDAADISPEAWRDNDAAYARIGMSQDALEGARAFTEKRAPRWTGR